MHRRYALILYALGILGLEYGLATLQPKATASTERHSQKPTRGPGRSAPNNFGNSGRRQRFRHRHAEPLGILLRPHSGRAVSPWRARC